MNQDIVVIEDYLQDVLKYVLENECTNYEETYDVMVDDIEDVEEWGRKHDATNHIYYKAVVLAEHYGII